MAVDPAPFEVERGSPKAAEWERLVRLAGDLLGRTDTVPSEIEDLVRSLGKTLAALSRRELASVDPYLVVALQGGALQTLLGLEIDDSAERRRQLRIGLERMRQALRDVDEGEAVGEDRTDKEVVKWLAETLDAPNAAIAELVGTSPRSFQRWLSPQDPAEPRGSDAARLRIVARVVNQLRHSLSGPGVLTWFYSPHPDLKDRQPANLLGSPQATETLIRLAAATRVSAAT